MLEVLQSFLQPLWVSGRTSMIGEASQHNTWQNFSGNVEQGDATIILAEDLAAQCPSLYTAWI